MIQLKGKVAFVTGGSQGIGAAIARKLARAKATVAVGYLKNQKKAREVIESIRAFDGKAFLLQGDVGDYLEAESLLRQVVEKIGKLDILINNAGIWEPNPVGDSRAEENWDRIIRTNLKSVYGLSTQSVPYLEENKGCIVNISSTAGQRGEAGYSHYAASKAGIIGLTKSLAAELGPLGIRVNAIAPGWVETDATMPYLQKNGNLEKAISEIPLRKIAKPDEIADSVLFLASSMASHITGEVLNVNGGSVLCG